LGFYLDIIHEIKLDNLSATHNMQLNSDQIDFSIIFSSNLIPNPEVISKTKRREITNT